VLGVERRLAVAVMAWAPGPPESRLTPSRPGAAYMTGVVADTALVNDSLSSRALNNDERQEQ
jgi:hypothetical protein